MKSVLLSAAFVLFLVLVRDARAFSTLQATYLVPEGEKLAPYSAFSLRSPVEWNEEAGIQSLKFTLPQELVGGRVVELSLSGEKSAGGTSVSLVGEGIQAQCSSGKRAIVCMMIYAFVPGGSYSAPTATEITRVVSSKYSDPEEVRGRTQVALHFLADPAGVLRIPLEE